MKAPVGPAELLLLPNSHADLVARPVSGLAIFEVGHSAPSQPTAQATHVNGHAEHSDGQPEMNCAVNGHAVKASASAGSQVNRVSSNGAHLNGTSDGHDSPPSSSDDFGLGSAQDMESEVSSKRRKSVRFSPTVESTTFLHSDPPSPNRSAGAPSKSVVPALPNGAAVLEPDATLTALPTVQPVTETTSDLVLNADAGVENKEHFQLAPEEAFFLAFSLGALKVVDPVTGSPISTEHLLSLFRSYSYFPPRAAGSDLNPHDPFLVNYAVYHHFRSLGWVPRHGIKFGVDWIIYQRGPVFDHSEFGIMVVPAYSDAAWEGREHQEPKKSWSWLMGVNRVLSHVLKSLVLVYVDIPPPAVFDEEMQRGGIAAALKKYTIREVMVRRFSVNRNR
jgi:tRNA-splicing endonuclease subunit Sen2